MAASADAELLHSVAEQRDKLLGVTRSLVQADSCNPPGDVSRVASAAADLVKALIPTAEVNFHESAPGIKNVVATIHGRVPGKTLVFSGHLDTYPTGDVSKWSVPPFSGAVSQDEKRLYGRGSADMKGGIAASLVAMSTLAEYAHLWNGIVVLALAGDEETMGQLGSAYLLENIDVVRKADAMICGDAGSPFVIRAGEKGLLWLEVSAEGLSAHGAHVHKGINAIEKLMTAIAAIKELENLPIEALPEVSNAISSAKAVSEPLSGPGEAKTLARITVNIGSMTGGTSMNLIPNQAQAAVDIRLPIGVSGAQIQRRIEDLLNPMQGISYRIIQQYDPTWTSISQPIVQQALAASTRVLGKDAVVNMRVGASDSRLFRAKGIPSVVVGLTPYNMGNHDEYLEVDELVQVAQIHALTAFEFLAP